MTLSYHPLALALQRGRSRAYPVTDSTLDNNKLIGLVGEPHRLRHRMSYCGAQRAQGPIGGDAKVEDLPHRGDTQSEFQKHVRHPFYLRER